MPIQSPLIMSSINSLMNLPILERVIDPAPLTVSPEMSLIDVISRMSQVPESHFAPSRVESSINTGFQGQISSSCVLVIDGTQLVGIFTEQDAVKLMASGMSLSEMRISDVMTQPIISLTLSTSVTTSSAWELFQQYPIRHLPVLDTQGQLVGVIHASQLLVLQEPSRGKSAPETELTQFNIHAQAVIRGEQASLQHLTQVEARLQENERQLSTLMDNLPGYVYRVKNDPNYTPEFISQGVFAITGYRQEEYLVDRTMTCGQEIHPEDADWVWNLVQQAVAAQQPYECEYRIITKAGMQKWVWERGRGIYGDKGELLFLEGFVTDISDRKYLELSLQASEAKLSQILDSAIAAIVSFRIWSNRDWEYTYFSAGCEALYGYTVSELMADKTLWMSQVDPDDREAIVMPLFEALFAERKATAEYRFCHKDGSVRWISSTYASQQIADDCWMVTAVNQDISERMRLEADRNQAETKIREQAALIDIAPDAIMVRDLDCRVLFWNKGAEQLYGWTTAEILGQDSCAHLFKQPAPQLDNALQILLDKGNWQGELTKVTKSGQEVLVSSRWKLLRDESGQAYAILSVDTDITAQKQLEVQFLRAQRLESLGTLASGIAHDLNNILAPIMAIAPLLPLNLPPLSERSQQLLNMLEENAKRGANLVKQILTFARGLEGERAPIQVKHLLRELEQTIRSTFPKSITITRNIATEDLWLVSADATQLHQVFMNFCVNARDAMPQGGTLSISADNKVIDETYAQMNLEAKVGSYVVITFADTGTGISPEHIDRIFDPFFTTKAVGEGTGLGLSTVLGIIKNHGGFVTVHSEVGKGTEFQVFLPAIAEGEISEKPSPELPMGHGELILVVDDEANIRETLKITLENQNYKVLTARDGIEAIATYVTHQTDIKAVLMDLMMPSMGGIAAIQALRKFNPQVKVIACSGLATLNGPTEMLEVSAFLAKPYTSGDLLRTLHQVLNEL